MVHPFTCVQIYGISVSGMNIMSDEMQGVRKWFCSVSLIFRRQFVYYIMGGLCENTGVSFHAFNKQVGRKDVIAPPTQNEPLPQINTFFQNYTAEEYNSETLSQVRENHDLYVELQFTRTD